MADKRFGKVSRTGKGKRLTAALLSYLLTLFVVVCDQLTKYLAVTYIKPRDTLPLIDGVLHFTYVENTGAAFGMMKNSRWVFMLFSSVAIVVLTVLIAKYAVEDRFISVTIALILGGGIGNMIDRIRLGYVVDFVDFRLINFAVFNVADSFVTVGAAFLIVYLISEIVKEARTAKKSESEDGGIDSGDGGSDR